MFFISFYLLQTLQFSLSELETRTIGIGVKMAFEIACPARYILVCSVFSALAGLVRTCNDNEYLHVKSGQCFECTKCADKDLVRWIPCSSNADTLCGAIFKWQHKWQPSNAGGSILREHSSVHAQNNASDAGVGAGIHTVVGAGVGTGADDEHHRQWRVIECVLTLTVVILTLVAIVLTIMYTTRIRRQRLIYRIILRDEVKSIQELGKIKFNFRVFFCYL